MSVKDIAERFVIARRTATGLSDYPGQIPAVLTQSYAVQDAAIALWNRPIIGWKIGRLAPDRQAEHGTERLAGPVFDTLFKPAQGTVDMPVFADGFAAVEAEYVFRVGRDAEVTKTDYSEAEALTLIDALFAGVEMAGSPLPTINALGPTVVASDFGNNFGLILGPQLMAFDDASTTAALDENAVMAFKARTEIDGAIVGEGGLFTMPGGPLKAIAWLAGHLAERGRPLTRGQLISSGATTGIHDIKPGQAACVTFMSESHKPIDIRLKTYSVKANQAELG